jgi:hypothetical protein
VLRALFLERNSFMSRIPAREAVIASSAVSAVVSLCMLGAVVAGSPAAAKVENATTTSQSPVLRPSPEVSGTRALIPGSHRGAWFGFFRSDVPAKAAGTAVPAPRTKPAITAPAAAPSTPAASPHAAVHQRSRSSVLAAVSGEPRDVAKALAASRGWTGGEWICLDKLWQHESKFQTTVRNSQSGAYGIPQALPARKMASAGADWRTNPVTQIMWGLGYIDARYGSPCGAWSYWVRHNSY